MISNTANKQAGELAEKLTMEGEYLVAVPGSAIEELARANISLVTQMTMDHQDAPNFTAEMIVDDSRPDHGGRHNDVMDHAVKVVGDTIRANLTLVRMTVIPTATDVLGEYLTHLESIYEADHAPVEIRPNIWDPIWSNSQLGQMFGSYERIENPNYRNLRHFPEMSVEDLQGLLVVGVPSIDELTETWRKRFTDERLAEIYTTVFRPGATPATLTNSTGIKHITPDGLYRDDLLACWMIARRVADATDNVSTMNLSEMRRQAMLIEHALGHGIFKELEKRAHIRKTDRLVFEESQRHVRSRTRGDEVVHVICVNNDVYTKWLTEGGTPELLFGAVVSKSTLQYSYMLENKAALELAWDKYRMRWEQIALTNELTVKRLAMKRAMHTLVRNMDLEASHVFMSLDEVTARIDEVVGSMHRMVFENERHLARRVVCDVLYPGTNARYILDTMAEVSKENEIDNPREAATLTSFDLYARWAASQLMRHKIK